MWNNRDVCNWDAGQLGAYLNNFLGRLEAWNSMLLEISILWIKTRIADNQKRQKQEDSAAGVWNWDSVSIFKEADVWMK